MRLPPPRALARRLSLPCSLSLLISCLSPCLSETKAGLKQCRPPPRALRPPSRPPQPSCRSLQEGGGSCSSPPPATHPPPLPRKGKEKKADDALHLLLHLFGRPGWLWGGWFGAGVRAAASPGGAQPRHKAALSTDPCHNIFPQATSPHLAKLLLPYVVPFSAGWGAPDRVPPPPPLAPQNDAPPSMGLSSRCRQGAREGGWMVVLQCWG